MYVYHCIILSTYVLYKLYNWTNSDFSFWQNVYFTLHIWIYFILYIYLVLFFLWEIHCNIFFQFVRFKIHFWRQTMDLFTTGEVVATQCWAQIANLQSTVFQGERWLERRAAINQVLPPPSLTLLLPVVEAKEQSHSHMSPTWEQHKSNKTFGNKTVNLMVDLLRCAIILSFRGAQVQFVKMWHVAKYTLNWPKWRCHLISCWFMNVFLGAKNVKSLRDCKESAQCCHIHRQLFPRLLFIISIIKCFLEGGYSFSSGCFIRKKMYFAFIIITERPQDSHSKPSKSHFYFSVALISVVSESFIRSQSGRMNYMYCSLRAIDGRRRVGSKIYTILWYK